MALFKVVWSKIHPKPEERCVHIKQIKGITLEEGSYYLMHLCENVTWRLKRWIFVQKQKIANEAREKLEPCIPQMNINEICLSKPLSSQVCVLENLGRCILNNSLCSVTLSRSKPRWIVSFFCLQTKSLFPPVRESLVFSWLPCLHRLLELQISVPSAARPRA